MEFPKTKRRKSKGDAGGASVPEAERRSTAADRDTAAAAAGQQITLSIAVPGSVIDNTQTAEQATAVAGLLARVAAIFRVDEFVVIDDSPPQARTGEPPCGTGAAFLARVLQYMETPQYLRKTLIPMHKDLRLAGRLPPLDAPHHQRAQEWSHFREGAVTASQAGHGSLLNIGLERSAHVEAVVPVGVRATVEVGPAEELVEVPGGPLGEARQAIKGRVVSPLAPRRVLGLYWGYSVRLATSLTGALSGCPFNGGGAYDVTLGTSERGTVDALQQISLPDSCRHVMVALGGPLGLEACYEVESCKPVDPQDVRDLFDHYVNVCPRQGSRTIRTEEALPIALQYLQPLWEGRKELVDLISRLPAEKRASSLVEARELVKANKGESNALKASDMLKEMCARISFLRMCTPKLARDRRYRAASGTFVLREGVLVEEEANRVNRVADGKISMDEAYRLHNRLLKRQYFGREPPKVREPF